MSDETTRGLKEIAGDPPVKRLMDIAIGYAMDALTTGQTRELFAAALRAAYHEGHDADVERCVAEEKAGWDALVAERDEEIARLRGEKAAIRDQAVDRWLDECEATARRYGIEPRQDECITVTLCEEVKRLRTVRDGLQRNLKAANDTVEEQDREIQHLKEALALSLADALDDEQLHALQRQREQPWIEKWQQATGKHDSLPDYGDLLAWIVDRADAAEAKLARRPPRSVARRSRRPRGGQP